MVQYVNVFLKKRVAPAPHSRSARCRSFGGVISKACFFCKLLQDISKKEGSKEMKMIEKSKKQCLFVCPLLLIFFINGCSNKHEQTVEPTYRERLEELFATYDREFIVYLERAQEIIGKNILTYSTISDQFTIPKYMEISGSYYDYGLLVGHIASQSGIQPRRVSGGQMALNNRIIEMYRQIYPKFLEIASGIGDVFDIPLEEMDFIFLEEGFFIGLWYNLLHYPAFESLGPSESADNARVWGNCAVVSANVQDTTLVGRNFDNDRERPHFVVYTRMDGAYKVMANAQYTIFHWVMDGINEKGLVMATANQASPPEYYRFFDPYPDFPVINEHHMFRIALETCATVDEVIALYRSVRPWSPDYADHLMVVDAQGNSAVIGLDTDREPTFFRSENSYQVLTNTAYHMGFDYLMNNCWRFQTATNMAEQGIGNMNDIKEIMQAIRGPAFGYMSVYDIKSSFMRLYLRHDFDTPWDYTLPAGWAHPMEGD
jgi:hypothetical protein